MPGPSEWLIIVLVLAALFGVSRLPALGRNFGLGIKEFKKGIREAGEEDAKDKDKEKEKDKSESAHPSGEERGSSA
jgi:sec-independent protein translocase protein TatA